MTIVMKEEQSDNLRIGFFTIEHFQRSATFQLIEVDLRARHNMIRQKSFYGFGLHGRKSLVGTVAKKSAECTISWSKDSESSLTVQQFVQSSLYKGCTQDFKFFGLTSNVGCDM
jgi:hypothetical protein